MQRAMLNILEDFSAERERLEGVQRAILNLLEDSYADKADLEGTQRAVLNILEDIDVEKARVDTVNRELESANKELESFTYSVSHDLRAPLRHIDGFAKLLLQSHGSELPEQAREYLSLICESTREMSQLVEDLLSLARIGRKELSLQITGLGSLVEEARAELQSECAGRDVAWKVAPLPFVECDPSLMKQVFVNLLSNAVKYTRPRPRAVIEIGPWEQDGVPGCFVRDNGVGFSMKHKDKLFGVFQRLHRQEDFEGTGVGLATVQRIIQKHGGRVWAEAELNQGATFYFILGTPKTAESESSGGRETPDGRQYSRYSSG